MTPVANQQRRWIPWRLRNLFIATTLFAAIAAYYAHWINERHRALRDPAIRLGNTCRDYELAWRMPVALRLVGEPMIKALVVSDNEYARVRSLFPESILYVGENRIADPPYAPSRWVE